jgi:hypothetical protein
LARPIVLIPHLFRFTDAINFRKDYSPPPLVRHLDPTAVPSDIWTYAWSIKYRLFIKLNTQIETNLRE